MSLGTVLSLPFFTGSVTSSEDWWDVILGGHGYALDWKQSWQRQTVEMIRAQADTSERPGEASLNPAGLWNRAQESWHLGAGQQYLDKPDASPYRFHNSKGLDPWTRHGLGLLNGVEHYETSASTNQFLACAQRRLYYATGNALSGTEPDAFGLSPASGTPAAAVTSLCSDGQTLYAAYGASGIYTNPASGLVFATHTTGQVDLVRYEKGRLVAASGKKLVNVVASGSTIALAKLLLDHPNPAWVWTDATSGQGFIYACGYAGDKSMIYRTAVAADGTDLGVPVVAGELPDGEIARSITGYLGFLVIGTDLGVRFAAADDAGNLTLGSVIPTTSPVLCGEGQDRFVWYGLTDYDATSTGLGRLDLSAFTGPLTPAWASDLMAGDADHPAAGAVTSVVTYKERRWFTVAGKGVYAEQTLAPVESGWVTSGRVVYGIPDTKRALSMGVRHDALLPDAQVTLALSTGGGPPVYAGASQQPGTTTSAPGVFELHQKVGDFFEWTATLVDGAHLPVEPGMPPEVPMCLRRVVLSVDPSAARTELSVIPLLLRDTVVVGGVPCPVDVRAEFDFLRAQCRNRTVMTLQEAGMTDTVVIEDFTWTPTQETADRAFYQGTFTVRVKSI